MAELSGHRVTQDRASIELTTAEDRRREAESRREALERAGGYQRAVEEYEARQARLASAEAELEAAYQRDVAAAIYASDPGQARSQALSRLQQRRAELVAELRLDQAPPGGRYVDPSGRLVDANGNPLD